VFCWNASHCSGPGGDRDRYGRERRYSHLPGFDYGGLAVVYDHTGVEPLEYLHERVDALPALAFAARATSSFPGASPPAVEPPPEVVVLTGSAAEERPKVVERDALQLGPALLAPRPRPPP